MDVIVYSIMFFIIGICFGSFFNVVGYRLPNNMSIAFPASHCTNCNHKLGALELIPIFSYLFQGGKCKHCKEKISCFYPIFEFLTGILFVLGYLAYKDIYPEILNIIYALLFISAMVIIMISDIKYMIIPDQVIIFFSIAIIIVKILIQYKLEAINDWMSFGYELLFILMEGLVMFLIMYLIRMLGNFLFKKESMGGGDIKMMMLIGFVLGYRLSIVVVFLASFLALPVAIINVYKKNDHMLPFGPFLAISALILFLSKVDFATLLSYLY